MPNHAKADYTRPDFGAIALVTIDVQNDFLDGQPFEIPGTSAAVPAMRKLVEAFRRARLPILHMVRLYTGDGGNAEFCRRSAIEHGAALVRPGTPGAQLASVGTIFRPGPRFEQAQRRRQRLDRPDPFARATNVTGT